MRIFYVSSKSVFPGESYGTVRTGEAVHPLHLLRFGSVINSITPVLFHVLHQTLPVFESARTRVANQMFHKIGIMSLLVIFQLALLVGDVTTLAARKGTGFQLHPVAKRC